MSHRAFEIESWTELAVGSIVVALRICARTNVVGVRNFRVDDYLIVVLLVSFIKNVLISGDRVLISLQMFWVATSWMGVIVG